MKQRARRPDVVRVIFHWGEFTIDLRFQGNVYFWAWLLLEKLL